MKNNKIQILWVMLFFVILAFHCRIPYTSVGWGRLSENSNGVKFSPTDNEKIDINC